MLERIKFSYKKETLFNKLKQEIDSSWCKKPFYFGCAGLAAMSILIGANALNANSATTKAKNEVVTTANLTNEQVKKLNEAVKFQIKNGFVSDELKAYNTIIAKLKAGESYSEIKEEQTREIGNKVNQLLGE